MTESEFRATLDKIAELHMTPVLNIVTACLRIVDNDEGRDMLERYREELCRGAARCFDG